MAPPAEKKKKHSSADHRSISSAAIGENQQQKPSKMKCHLRKIWICTDVLMDILPSFDRPQLGLKMALLSPRFEFLVNKHFDGKSELTIWRHIEIHKDDGMPKLFVSIDCANSVPFPLPDCPLPIKIRFKNLRIEYIDHSVLAFLRSNKQIWDRSGTKLDLNVPSIYKEFVQPIWNAFVGEIWPIFATNVCHLILPDDDHLDNLRRLISPTILTDLNQLNSITIEFQYPDVTADDGPNATAGQALSKWLHTPTKDGQPKRLCCRFYTDPSVPTEWIENFRMAFLRATTPSSARYTIQFLLNASMPIVPFGLVNERAQEKLTLEKDGNFEHICQWVMKRCPIGETTDQWNDDNWDNLNGLVFRFYGGKNCIGPLCPPTAEEEAAVSARSKR